MKITTASKTITTAATRERMVSVANNVAVRGVNIVAKTANTGAVYVGDSAVSSAVAPKLNPGDSLSLSAGDELINLSDIYLDVDTSGEGVDFWALE